MSTTITDCYTHPEGPQPQSILIPVYDKSETDLIAALETLMGAFAWLDDHDDCCARYRAADWLAAKYGSPK